MLRIGVNRRLDSLGRIVIPKELRKTYCIKENDVIEIIGTEEGILLKVPDLYIRRKEETDKCGESQKSITVES